MSLKITTTPLKRLKYWEFKKGDRLGKGDGGVHWNGFHWNGKL